MDCHARKTPTPVTPIDFKTFGHSLFGSFEGIEYSFLSRVSAFSTTTGATCPRHFKFGTSNLKSLPEFVKFRFYM